MGLTGPGRLHDMVISTGNVKRAEPKKENAIRGPLVGSGPVKA